MACVCVRERERERERESVCVCVRVCERETERECVRCEKEWLRFCFKENPERGCGEAPECFHMRWSTQSHDRVCVYLYYQEEVIITWSGGNLHSGCHCSALPGCYAGRRDSITVCLIFSLSLFLLFHIITIYFHMFRGLPSICCSDVTVLWLKIQSKLTGSLFGFPSFGHTSHIITLPSAHFKTHESCAMLPPIVAVFTLSN